MLLAFALLAKRNPPRNLPRCPSYVHRKVFISRLFECVLAPAKFEERVSADTINETVVMLSVFTSEKL